jgi:membrane protein DedA with SNARE-associated domain
MHYYLLDTTYPILFLYVFAHQLCLPVPAVPFLLSGGALAGTGRLSFLGILLVAMVGCLLADMACFEAGRLRGKRNLRLLCALCKAVVAAKPYSVGAQLQTSTLLRERSNQLS